jgi:hypothetical protein
MPLDGTHEMLWSLEAPAPEMEKIIAITKDESRTETSTRDDLAASRAIEDAARG